MITIDERGTEVNEIIATMGQELMLAPARGGPRNAFSETHLHPLALLPVVAEALGWKQIAE